MTEFTLHGIPGSPYVRAVALALEEKSADWTLAAIPIGAHRAQDYRAIHPFQKIPTLDHGNFRLYETHAILRYLDRVCAGLALVPEDPRQAARVDQMISLTNDYVVRQVLRSAGRAPKPFRMARSDGSAAQHVCNQLGRVDRAHRRRHKAACFRDGLAVNLSHCDVRSVRSPLKQTG